MFLADETLAQSPETFVRNMCSAIGLPVVDVPKQLLKSRVNISKDVRFQILIRTATRLSKWLRSLRMYSFIDLLKRMGIQGVLYKPLNQGYSLHPHDKAPLFDLLKDEYDFLNVLNRH